MHAMRWLGLVSLLFLLLVPAAIADEPAESARARLIEKALDALTVRLEARTKEADLLSKSGRIQEALEAYRSVGDLYERGMAGIHALFVPRTSAKAESDRPFDTPALRPSAAGASSAQEAVDRALEWLGAHQAPTGAWQSAGFADWCKGKPIVNPKFGPDGRGKGTYDVGVTGLALMAFHAAGHTHRGKHRHAETVKRGLRYLKSMQDTEGCFGPRSSQHFIYNHALASVAVIEAYALTRSPIFRASAQKAIDFLLLARNPYMAWRYGVRPGDNDTSVTSWAISALHLARQVNAQDQREGRPAPFKLDAAAFDGALAWVDKMTDAEFGRVGYNNPGSPPARPQELVARFPSDRSEAMTAAGILTRIHCGQDPRKNAQIRKGAELCVRRLPVWNPADGSIDMYYWYQATLALAHVGGKPWQAWSQALGRAAIGSQRRDGDVCSFLGSWDPIGPWGPDGGRVYSTALMALSLSARQHAQAGLSRAGRSDSDAR